jgi:hypothetical protein
LSTRYTPSSVSGRPVPNDERLDRDRGDPLFAAGDDLAGHGEARTDRGRRLVEPDLDLEVDRLGALDQREQIRVVLGDRRGADLRDRAGELAARIGVDLE